MNDTPFESCVRLLLLHHAFAMRGSGQSDEALELLVEMDDPWKKMTEAQQELAGELSAVLNDAEDAIRSKTT